MAEPESERRVLIDSNVWRYLVDTGRIEDLRRAAKVGGVRIVAAPAVLYEALRTGDADLRRRLVKAITLGAWHRPMPLVYTQCEAVLAEVTRLRPE